MHSSWPIEAPCPHLVCKVLIEKIKYSFPKEQRDGSPAWGHWASGGTHAGLLWEGTKWDIFLQSFIGELILPNKQLSGGYILKRLLSLCARLVPGHSSVKFCFGTRAGPWPRRPRTPGRCRTGGEGWGAGRAGCKARPGAGLAHPPAFAGLPRRGHHINTVALAAYPSPPSASPVPPLP